MKQYKDILGNKFTKKTITFKEVMEKFDINQKGLNGIMVTSRDICYSDPKDKIIFEYFV